MTAVDEPPHPRLMDAAREYPPEWDVEVPPARDNSARWAKRKRRVIARAQEMRDELIAKLGGKCRCGATELLEFHHPKGRDWVAAKKNRYARMVAYRRDHARGLIELLCAPCNKKAGAPRGFWQHSNHWRRR